jgi:adenine-specific DNA-methyltransferase
MDMTDALINQLRDAAPQIFSEGRVDFAKLQTALGEHIDSNPERYGLTWAGKRDAFRNVQVPSVATLRPQPEESVNWDSTENLIIEGDNLEVLKLLQKPYHAKVKMIYIDPPYNTGNEFIYPDNYREGLDEYLRYTGQLGEDGTATSTNKDTSGRYHSNWLNMMYPRLFLARNLLKEDGVIFVSIDDHEVHNLRLLMDEVFGEENFVGSFIWHKKLTGGYDNKNINSQHDYILTYARSIQNFDAVPEIKESNYKLIDEHGKKFKWDSLWNIGGLTYSASLDYPITAPDGSEIWPIGERGIAFWLWSRKKVESERSQLKFEKDKNGLWKVYKRVYASDGVVPGSMLDKEIVKGNTHSSAEMKNIFDGNKIFDYAKPTPLIKYLAARAMKQEDIVLDFFAGSGTTAHAVLDLNQEDGGNRRFILVQLPEKTDNPQYPTIAHITRERVRRVIAKLQENRHSSAGRNPVIQEAFDLNPLDSGLRRNDGDLGFRAFKLDSSNFKIWRSDQAPQSAEQLAEQLSLYADNVLAERGDQDRLYELILKCGMPLSARVEEIPLPISSSPSTGSGRTACSVSDGNLLICLEPHLDRDTLRALFARKPQMVLCLDTAFDGNDALKTNTVLEAQTHGIIFKTV